MRFKYLFAAIVLLMVFSGVTICQAAPENIFPDPSFEMSGVTGTARTGERAGTLSVGAQTAWTPMPEMKIKVEPFATYRVTGYAKGSCEAGNLVALYVYSWNSYDWAFNTEALVTNPNDWQAVEATFVCPVNTITFHPLVFHNGKNGTGWIDDVSIVKIKSTAETMKERELNPNKSDADIQLLARFYFIKKKSLNSINALLVNADAKTKSDVACFLAKNTPNKANRVPYIIDMVRYDGMTYHNADTRLNEMTDKFTPAEKSQLVAKIADALPGNLSAAKACAQLAAPVANSEGLSLSQKTAILATAEKSTTAMKKAFDGTPETKAVVVSTINRIELAREDLDYQLAHKGSKLIYIGNKIVSPKLYVIAIPNKPTIQEKCIARDFQLVLEQITGNLIPITSESKVGKKSAFLLGKTSAAIKAGVNFKKLGLEGIAIKTSGSNLILAGNKRGVFYASYSFLENTLGCKWFTPDCSVIPNTGKIKITKINKTYIPPLEHRSTDYPHSCNQYWAVKNMINGNQPNIDEEHGNCIRYQGFVHTFNYLVQPEKYYAQHPEYFSEMGGIRIGPSNTQLCLTNPDVLKIATESVKEWFRSNPAATIVSVSQNDYWNYCQCANCTALAEKEGSQSGPLIHFVNGIAAAVKDEFPDKIIDTLAYQYTRKPPKFVKPLPNVVIRLCSIECCFVHPLDTCPFNASFKKDMQDWSNTHKRMWIWDYVINYAHTIMPFPNLYSLKPNINFYINNGVTGIYEEADYYTKGGEMAELRTWIMAKTLWDPTYDTDKAIDEFLPAYFGKAGPFVRSYVNLIHKQVKDNPDTHITIYTGPQAGNLTPEIIKRSNELFDAAEDAVKNDDRLLHRVQVARLPIMYTMIAMGYSGYVEDGNTLFVPKNRVDGGLAAAFEKIARKEGVTMINEGTSLDNWLNSLNKEGESLQVIKLANPSLSLSLLPGAGGRIWKMSYLPTNKELMRVYGKPGSLQPKQGGYEEFSNLGYRSPGWSDVYTVSEQTNTSIKLEATLSNGLKFSRVISLDAAKPVVNIKSTITNASTVAIESGIRVHPEFSASEVNKGYLAVKKGDGTWGATSLLVTKDPDSEKEIWMRGAAKPAGEWAFIDGVDGLGIVNRFNPNQVDLTYFNYFGNGGRINLELFPKATKLEPGQSISLDQSYEIVPDAMNKLGAKVQ